MNRKLLFIFIIFNLKINIKSDIIDETIEVNKVKITNVIFYCFANKGLLPNVNYTKSLKYCDFYCGASNGFELYFINKEKFKLGLFSLRHETLNFLFNTLVTKCDKNIGFYLQDSFLFNFLTGFVISFINIKFGPISINFLNLHLVRYMFPWPIHIHPSLKKGFKEFMKAQIIMMNSTIISNVYIFMMLFFPNIKIDISQLIYNIKNKKSFLNLLHS